MNFKRFFLIPTLALITLTVFTSCEEEDTPTTRVNFEITDAPIDDTDIQGVFVTVASVSVNGETATDFNGKTTVDLLTLQNGNTKALGSSEVEANTNARIELELDYQTDAQGNSPGCYVLTSDNVKHALSTDAEGKLSFGNLNTEASSNSTFVMDFDVRKAVRYAENETQEDRYDFATQAELESSVRVVSKERSLNITGNVDYGLSGEGDYVVAYLYKKGEFNQAQETSAQGSSDIMFKNALTSAKVAASGDYRLSYVEGGEYELYFVKYEPAQEQGRLEASSFLQVNSLTSLNILGLEAVAGVDLTVNVLVTGTTPF